MLYRYFHIFALNYNIPKLFFWILFLLTYLKKKKNIQIKALKPNLSMYPHRYTDQSLLNWNIYSVIATLHVIMTSVLKEEYSYNPIILLNLMRGSKNAKYSSQTLLRVLACIISSSRSIKEVSVPTNLQSKLRTSLQTWTCSRVLSFFSFFFCLCVRVFIGSSWFGKSYWLQTCRWKIQILSQIVLSTYYYLLKVSRLHVVTHN